METITAPRTGLHPLVATATVAIIIASGVGIAAMTGLLPGSAAKHAEPAIVAQAPAPVVAPAPQPLAVVEPAPVAKPVVKAAPKPKPIVHQAAATPPAPRPEAVQVAQAPAAGTYPAVPPDYRPALPPTPVASAKPVCYDCGTVDSMREVDMKGEGTGLGAVAGGIGGLILGKQLGNGKGQNVGAVLGAAGGAYAGHQVEKNVKKVIQYEISVRMDDASMRNVSYDAEPGFRTGDKVRFIDGRLTRY